MPSPYTIIPVETPAQARQFLELQPELYRNDPVYIRPLDQDIENVFNPEQNKSWKNGKAQRWLLLSDGKPAGRVAAFYDERNLSNEGVKAGGLGFFECIDDDAAAGLLLETAENWLKEKGFNAVDGPVNFGDRGQWWGLNIEGFHPANYACNYNHAYYRRFFDRRGYQEYFRQYTYRRPVEEPLHPRVLERAQRTLNEPGYSFGHIKKADMSAFVRDFRHVYNLAWGNHEGVRPMTEDQVWSIAKKMKPWIDERIIWFTYYNGEAVAFFVMVPDLNQIFRHLGGKLNWIGKLKFLYYRYLQPLDKMVGMVYGVVPEHQGKGLESAMVIKTGEMVQNNPRMSYSNFEMNWIGDFNPRMMKLAQLMGGKEHKVHCTFRKIFDPAIPFERHKVLG